MIEDVPIIELEQVSFTYAELPVLENVDFNLMRGEFIGLVGPNGGGKSTLLKLILGLLQPTQGRVKVLGKSSLQSRIALGYVPQFANFSRNFPISVENCVLLGRLGRSRRWFGYSHADREIAGQAMKETAIWDLRKRHIQHLSGGQLQRVLIARALACEPQVLLLDEATANIDMRAEEGIFDLLKRLNEHLSIILVSHDVGFISRYVGRVACLNRTLLCHPTEQLTGANITELYDEAVHAIHHEHLTPPFPAHP